MMICGLSLLTYLLNKHGDVEIVIYDDNNGIYNKFSAHFDDDNIKELYNMICYCFLPYKGRKCVIVGP